MSSYGWDSPPRDVMEKYEERCEAFVRDDELFANFKRDPDYTKILEGNEVDVGIAALWGINKWGKIITNRVMADLPRFKENESVGNPRTLRFQDFGEIAPSTLRYINSCVDIWSLVENKKMKRIIEIGGGYGGLCKTFDVYFNGFDSYTIIDLPWASKLTEKYLSKFNLGGRTTCVSITELDKVNTEDIDLLIADSSLAECNLETQLMYVDRLVRHASHVYMIYNTVHTPSGFSRFVRVVESMTSRFDVRAMTIPQPHLFTEQSTNIVPEPLLGVLIVLAQRRK
jgi:hypothetical protein